MFAFDLPPHLIAAAPCTPRDAARMLVAMPDAVHLDQHVRDLPAWLQPGDLLVTNDSKVLPVRIWATHNGVRMHMTLLAPQPQQPGRWGVLVQKARRLKHGDRVEFAPDWHATIDIEPTATGRSEIILRFDRPDTEVFAMLDEHGSMPIPPYIARTHHRPQDRHDYQTIFATHPGSVAAPTAGLHFTDALLQQLNARAVDRVSVTLHVGLGTFAPLRDPEQTRLHEEWCSITPEVGARIAAQRQAGKRVIAVGTTAARTLESAARSAVPLEQGFRGMTDLFIRAGHRFAVVDGLMTNFHLPESSLLHLVGTFWGEQRIQELYAQAILHEFRFYSFGDAMLLLPQPRAGESL